VLNEDGDPYPLTIINNANIFKKISTVISRAFSTSIFGHKMFVGEAEQLKPYGYGGLAMRYLCWRESVMMMGALFLCYSLGDDAYHKIAGILAIQHHASTGDIYRKLFHTEILIETVSDSIYALSLLTALCFWLYGLYQWKNYLKSARALKIGYVISFVVPFLLMLTFPYRKGIDIEVLAQDSCHSVINGRIPDILTQMVESGKHSTVHGAKKAARHQSKPDIKAKFNLLANHIPAVNLTSMFHRLHVEVPSTICDFKNPHWSANIKQTFINAGFVRDQTTNSCPAAIKALKTMHMVPKHFNPSPKFRHLLESDENSEVFSLDTNKKFTKKQCKPCETCVDPQCRQHAVHLLGKHFSLSPAITKSLHIVKNAKKAMHEMKKDHEKQLEDAKHELKESLHKIGTKFEHEAEKSSPELRKVIEEGKKVLKVLDVKGLAKLHKFNKKLKVQYKKLQKQEHGMLIALEKQQKKAIKLARAHGKHAWKEAKKKYSKKFKQAKVDANKKLAHAHKKMIWKIRKAKAQFLAKKASVASKVAAARHARVSKAKGGEKVLLKYQARLRAKATALEKKYKDRFDAHKKKIKVALKKKKAAYAKELKGAHDGKKYVAKLKHFMAKVTAAEKKALAKVNKAEARMLKRLKHAKASRFYSSNKDIQKLLNHIKKHAKLNMQHSKNELLKTVLKFNPSGNQHLKAIMRKARGSLKKAYQKRRSKFLKLKKAAWDSYNGLKVQQYHLIEDFKKDLKKNLNTAKKSDSSPKVYKKAQKEAKAKLDQMKKEGDALLTKAHELMRTTIDQHHKKFAKDMKSAKASFQSIRKKLHAKKGFLHTLTQHVAVFKEKYEKNKEEYHHNFHVEQAKLRSEIEHAKKTMENNGKMKATVTKAEKKIAQLKAEMKHNVKKAKTVYKAHKAELKTAIIKLKVKADQIENKFGKHGRKLLSEDPVFLAQQEMVEDAEMRSHSSHFKTPTKCASCHAACYKNCALQYFGPAILKNTISEYMCMGTQQLNSLDTVKNAMDAVGHIDYLLGAQSGLQAFGLLLPASLSFLSAVLKATKLTKKILPQSRLAGYLVVLAAISNVPILSALIAMAYQAVGDVFFCLGCLCFLSTFVVFFTRIENLVKSQSHAEANKEIDRRATMTFIGFAGAGIFLGIFVLGEHASVIKMAMKLPLATIVVKKICDFLGRTMFTFVVLVDLIFSLFSKLYGPQGDKLDEQEFSVPLKQIKRLFVNRDELIEELEA